MPLQAMIHILQEQKKLYMQLLELAEEKKNAIIDNNIEILNKSVNKEAKWIKLVGELEEKRVFELNRYIVGKGYKPNPNITMSDMLKLVFKAEERLKLQGLQSELAEIIDKLKHANDTNKRLIGLSLQFVNYSLELVMGAPDDDAVYTNPNQQPPSYNRPGLFDARG